MRYETETRTFVRNTLPALRKEVTARSHGGDATRKRKLLDKPKAGKKKMRQFGRIDIPPDAFISELKMDGRPSTRPTKDRARPPGGRIAPVLGGGSGAIRG